MKIGYDIHLSKSIQDAFSKAGVQCLFKHPVNKETDINNFNTFLLDNLRNEIILYDLNSIGSFTFIQLSKTFSIIDDHNINITILNSYIGTFKFKEDFISILKEIVFHEEKATLERTRKGLINARKMGRIGGRPKISIEKKEIIQTLYFDKKKSLREIAEIVDLSLGTVHKYTKI